MRKEITINQSVDGVWKALTQPDIMKKWYFNISNFEAKKGEIYDFIVTITDEDREQDFRHLFEILEAIPNKKLKHSWEYPGLRPGTSTLTWEPSQEGKETKIILKHEGIENIADENSKYFSKESYNIGWDNILNKLKQYLENNNV